LNEILNVGAARRIWLRHTPHFASTDRPSNCVPAMFFTKAVLPAIFSGPAGPCPRSLCRRPVARIVDGSVVFDAQSLALESEDERRRVGALPNVTSAVDKPQLCPDPGPDVPHGASARAIAYQAFISALNNPQRPLPPGMAVSLNDPQTGRRVVYDECREADGAMIEAKGPGYAKLLKYSYFSEEIFLARWTKQAARQVDASGGRDLEWYFAEDAASTYARRLFRKAELQKIRVISQPME
jgi:hypothetical protein